MAISRQKIFKENKGNFNPDLGPFLPFSVRNIVKEASNNGQQQQMEACWDRFFAA